MQALFSGVGKKTIYGGSLWPLAVSIKGKKAGWSAINPAIK